jgi:mycoredoxin
VNDTGTPNAVTVYTRPGCPYSFMLRRGLRRRGVAFDEVDIWQNPDAAAAVRRVADGNETVPTVHVAGRWLVNPSARAVAALARG